MPTPRGKKSTTPSPVPLSKPATEIKGAVRSIRGCSGSKLFGDAPLQEYLTDPHGVFGDGVTTSAVADGKPVPSSGLVVVNSAKDVGGCLFLGKTTIPGVSIITREKRSDTSDLTTDQIKERDRLVNERLAKRYDALNTAFTTVEALLRSYKPIRDVWITYGHQAADDEGRYYSWEMLGMAKYQEKWRLVHAYDADYEEYGFTDLKPLVECPVAVRVKAAKEIRNLGKAIVEDKEKFVPQVEEAIKELSDFCTGK